MGNPFKVLRPWRPGDTRELTHRGLKQAQLEGRFDSYSQVYELDGQHWKIQSQVSQPNGETLYTLVAVGE